MNEVREILKIARALVAAWIPSEDEVIKAIRGAGLKPGRAKRYSDGVVIDVYLKGVPAQMNKHYKMDVILDGSGVWVNDYDESPNDAAKQARDYRHLISLLKDAKELNQKVLKMTYEALKGRR